MIEHKLEIEDSSANGSVTIIDADRLCYIVKSSNNGAVGLRTISKALVKEYVEYLKTHQNANAQEAREALSGKSEIDKFEYGYSSTLTVLAKMILGLIETEKNQEGTMPNGNVIGPEDKAKPLQLIFFGAPGTGKSFTIKELTEGEDVIRTTFHPDSDYSTFVGCYKPTSVIEEVMTVIGTKAVPVENQDGSPKTETKIVYDFVPQAFLQAYVSAWQKYAQVTDGKPQKQYLVVEEINRGNCAQIFGDFFQLLDRNAYGFSEYPIKADADLKKHLKWLLKDLSIENADAINALYKGEDVVSKVLNGDELLLPSNLYIWATMNTSDQSLFPIDSAFKRRWDWQYVPIANAHKDWAINVNGKRYDWWDFLEKVNALIGETTNSEDKKLGYFFCKPTDGVITAEAFVSKVLFYLWNDVFKDFEFDGDTFIDEDKETKLTFDKFYLVDATSKPAVRENKVEVFLSNLGVTFADKAEEDFDDDELEDLDENNNGASSSSISPDGKDRSRYSINGQGSFNKRKLPVECVINYLQSHPDITASELVDTWMSLGVKTSNLVETKEQHEARRGSDPQFDRRSFNLSLPNGEIVFVSNQFGVERINDFIEKVNAQDWGIYIERIGESLEGASSSLQNTRSGTGSQRFYVTFPDGSVIEERTQFETYTKTLERIGLDRAESIAAQKRYTRKRCALIDRIQRDEILNSRGFSYVTINGFHIVKGILVNTMVDVLNNISEILNLRLDVKLTRE